MEVRNGNLTSSVFRLTSLDLPSSLLHLGLKRSDLQSRHRLTETDGYLQYLLRILEMNGRFHDGFCHLLRILGFEDAGPDEDAFRSELHE